MKLLCENVHCQNHADIVQLVLVVDEDRVTMNLCRPCAKSEHTISISGPSPSVPGTFIGVNTKYQYPLGGVEILEENP